MNKLPAIVPQLSEAHFFDASSQQRLHDCWALAQHHYPQGVRRCQLHWLHWPHPQPQGRIVLVPGRIEAAHKYLETILDLHVAGYEVWSIDHRGQGESARETANDHMGYVTDFNDYCLDLQQLLQSMQTVPYPTIALAHSMGGAILYRTLQQFGHQGLQGAIFCSPMFGILTTPIPTWFATPLAKLMQHIQPQRYVPGQQDYVAKPFQDNELTQSEARYRWFRQLYQTYPQYQLGGVSWGWLNQALTACHQIATGPALSLPVCVVQAGGDRIVDNSQQQRLCLRHNYTLTSIAGAEHELLSGTDRQRQQGFAAINQWLGNLDLPTTAVY